MLQKVCLTLERDYMHASILIIIGFSVQPMYALNCIGFY